MIDSREDRSSREDRQDDDPLIDENPIDDPDPSQDLTNPTNPANTTTPTPTPLSPPAPFNTMTNQLQVCNWLVENSDYLKLANEMLAAKNMDIDSSRIFVRSTVSVETEDSEVSIIL